MKIKLDENLGSRTADLYRKAGHEVATVRDQAVEGAPDSQLFTLCAKEKRVLVTLDLDFASPLRFDPRASAGIAVLRVPELPGRGDLVATSRVLIAALARADITGHLWVVDERRVREYQSEDVGVQ